MGNEINQNDKKRHSDTKLIADTPKTAIQPNSTLTNKSDDDQKQQMNNTSPQYEYIDDKIVQMNTAEYTFKTGEKIDARDKNGLWKQYKILDIAKSQSTPNKCTILKVAAVDSANIMKLEVTSLNICLCNEYCFKYNPTQLKWSNHMVAAPNTQSQKWTDLQMSLFNNVTVSSDQKPKVKPKRKVLRFQPLHFKFTLIVFGYMRQNYEKECNELIPMDIKQLIYMFWEYWSRLKMNDGLRIKNITYNRGFGTWQGAVVRYAKISNNHLQIMYAYCPNILKIGDTIDAKDRDGKWYIAEIIAIKRAKKKFPMDPPKKKKKKLKKLAAIYVHFLEFGDRFNEWIFMKDGVMCNCTGQCYDSNHRITFAKIQSDGIGGETGTINITENKFCNCIEKCDKNEHRLKYTENYDLVRSSDMFCFC